MSLYTSVSQKTKVKHLRRFKKLYRLFFYFNSNFTLSGFWYWFLVFVSLKQTFGLNIFRKFSKPIRFLILNILFFSKLKPLNFLYISVIRLNFLTHKHTFSIVENKNIFNKSYITYINSLLSTLDFSNLLKKKTQSNGFLQTSTTQSLSLFTGTVQRSYDEGELDSFEVFFLRKNRVFNKGRYSRNRQNYRTGVYICFYLSILSIFGLYYTFYKFSFNFSYLWFGFFFFLSSFIFNKALKYNLITYRAITRSINKLVNWLFNIKY